MQRMAGTQAELASHIKNHEEKDNEYEGWMLHKLDDEQEILRLAYELIETHHQVYGAIAINYGVNTLSNSLRERAATMGVVGALVAGMLYPFVIAPPLADDGDFEEICLYIAIICWTVAICSAVVCVAVATHQIALLGAFIARDADLLRFVMAHYHYIDSPDYLLALTLICTLIGIVANAFATLPVSMGVIMGIICVVFWVGFGIAWGRGTKFWKSMDENNVKLLSDVKQELFKND